MIPIIRYRLFLGLLTGSALASLVFIMNLAEEIDLPYSWHISFFLAGALGHWLKIPYTMKIRGGFCRECKKPLSMSDIKKYSKYVAGDTDGLTFATLVKAVCRDCHTEFLLKQIDVPPSGAVKNIFRGIIKYPEDITTVLTLLSIATKEKISKSVSDTGFKTEDDGWGYQGQTVWEKKKVLLKDLVNSIWHSSDCSRDDLFNLEYAFDLWGLDDNNEKIFLQLFSSEKRLYSTTKDYFYLRIFRISKSEYLISKCKVYQVNTHDRDK